MLAASFISQIQQRFSHEKRARVCLWFDPASEFVRLLSLLQAHLETLSPSPFRLLAYDAKSKHGQLWLKRQVWVGSQQNGGRFVLYLPFAEERLNSPDEQARNHLELLTEYHFAGVDWKVGGKRPTLFSFLKATGVALPDSQVQQRKLVDGGADSLLAKYAARFAEKPPAFWEETVTPELVRCRLVGDVDQTILDLAVDPETKWEQLSTTGVLAEFLASVREGLGYAPDTDNPALWIKALVERLALTEAFVGYGEPDDFPFADRIAPLRNRESHVALLSRWLRDANSRGAWDRAILDVEQHINLTAWAKGKDGAAYGFPHLVSLRWEKAVSDFVETAGKTNQLESYVAETAFDLQREVEYARASATPGGCWDTLLGVSKFIGASARARRVASSAASLPEFVRVFLDFAADVDGAHLQLKAETEELGLGDIGHVIDRAYADYTNALNRRFFEAYTATDALDILGLPFVTTHLDTHVWSANLRRAVIIVDALRYDCGIRLKGMLSGCDVRVEPMRAMLPTRTPIGMSALMTSSFTPTSLEIKGNELHPKSVGLDLSQRENRLTLLRRSGADCRDIDEVEPIAEKPGKLSQLLVIFGHEEVDHLGHGSGNTLIRHIKRELERIARLVKKLHQWGYPEVNVITDHGFVLLDEAQLPPEVPVKPEWCMVLKERFAIVRSGADLPLKTKPFPWDRAVRVAIPPGLAFFKAEKSFSHGGATLQELVIPRLISRSQTRQQKVGVEVLLGGAGTNLTSAAVKVVLRPVLISEAGEFAALVALPRNLVLDVTQKKGHAIASVLPRSEARTVQLQTSGEHAVTLFFDSKYTFAQGDELRLEIRDQDTGEQFPGPGGVILHVARNL